MKRIYKAPIVWAENEAWSFPMKDFTANQISVIRYDWDEEVVYFIVDGDESAQAVAMACGCDEEFRTKKEIEKKMNNLTKKELKSRRGKLDIKYKNNKNLVKDKGLQQ